MYIQIKNELNANENFALTADIKKIFKKSKKLKLVKFFLFPKKTKLKIKQELATKFNCTFALETKKISTGQLKNISKNTEKLFCLLKFFNNTPPMLNIPEYWIRDGNCSAFKNKPKVLSISPDPDLLKCIQNLYAGYSPVFTIFKGTPIW